ncbi:MAG: hypothetical protein ACJAWV_000042 [Flammeovirgaceae bacterium]|jgi:hypothetical protein
MNILVSGYVNMLLADLKTDIQGCTNYDRRFLIL